MRVHLKVIVARELWPDSVEVQVHRRQAVVAATAMPRPSPAHWHHWERPQQAETFCERSLKAPLQEPTRPCAREPRQRTGVIKPAAAPRMVAVIVAWLVAVRWCVLADSAVGVPDTAVAVVALTAWQGAMVRDPMRTTTVTTKAPIKTTPMAAAVAAAATRRHHLRLRTRTAQAQAAALLAACGVSAQPARSAALAGGTQRRCCFIARRVGRRTTTRLRRRTRCASAPGSLLLLATPRLPLGLEWPPQMLPLVLPLEAPPPRLVAMRLAKATVTRKVRRQQRTPRRALMATPRRRDVRQVR